MESYAQEMAIQELVKKNCGGCCGTANHHLCRTMDVNAELRKFYNKAVELISHHNVLYRFNLRLGHVTPPVSDKELTKYLSEIWQEHFHVEQRERFQKEIILYLLEPPHRNVLN